MKNNELTALECVEELKRLLADSHIEGKWSKQTHKYFSNIVETIEITLKAYENALDGLDAEMRKNQKALEIIKQKQVCVYLLNGCDTVEQYNNTMDLFEIPKKDRHKYHLTKEEFNLLKEVML